MVSRREGTLALDVVSLVHLQECVLSQRCTLQAATDARQSVGRDVQQQRSTDLRAVHLCRADGQLCEVRIVCNSSLAQHSLQCCWESDDDIDSKRRRRRVSNDIAREPSPALSTGSRPASIEQRIDVEQLLADTRWVRVVAATHTPHTHLQLNSTSSHHAQL